MSRKNHHKLKRPLRKRSLGFNIIYNHYYLWRKKRINLCAFFRDGIISHTPYLTYRYLWKWEILFIPKPFQGNQSNSTFVYSLYLHTVTLHFLLSFRTWRLSVMRRHWHSWSLQLRTLISTLRNDLRSLVHNKRS